MKLRTNKWGYYLVGTILVSEISRDSISLVALANVNQSAVLANLLEMTLHHDQIDDQYSVPGTRAVVSMKTKASTWICT